MFYLYRNGRGETYYALQKAKTAYIDSEIAKTELLISIAGILEGGLLIALLCFTAIGLALAMRLNASMRVVSSLLLTYNSKIYNIHMLRMNERLQEKYGVMSYLSITRPAKSSSRVFLLFTPIWYVVIPLVVLWVFCAVFYLTFQFTCMQSMSFLLRANPAVISYDSTRLVNLIEIGTLAAENFLAEIGFAASLLVSDGVLISSYKNAIDSATEKLKSASMDLLELAAGKFPLNTAHYNFVYTSTNFSSVYFRHGYRSGTQVLNWDAMFCINSGWTECVPIVELIFGTYVELASRNFEIAQYYRNDGEDRIKVMAGLISGVLASGSVLVVLGCVLFLVFVLPVLHRKTAGLVKLAAIIKLPGNNDSSHLNLPSPKSILDDRKEK